MNEDIKKFASVARAPLPSPNRFFSGWIAEGSFSQLLAGPDSESPGMQEQRESKPPNIDPEGRSSTLENAQKPPIKRGGGKFGERFQARDGFSAPRLNAAKFKCLPSVTSPGGVRSPTVIPPGMSPSTLLDSPVLLSTSLAEQSPTTGSYPLPPLSFEGNVSSPRRSFADGIKANHSMGGPSSPFNAKSFVSQESARMVGSDNMIMAF